MRQLCYWCDKSNLFFYKSIKSDSLIKCLDCGLVQTKEGKQRENTMINKTMYSKEYLANYLSRETILKSRFKKRLTELETFAKGGKLLDVGCSVGFFLEVVKDQSKYPWELFGLDMNKLSIRTASRRLQVHLKLGTLQNAKYKSNFFDCVTCFDVLEHDTNLKNTLIELSRILKPGGLLILQSPNYKSVMARFSGENWDWWSIPDHVIHFDEKTIRNVLSVSGFLVEFLTTWEDKSDFVLNIAGNIRKSFPKFFEMHRISAKIATFFLPVLWRSIKMFESKSTIGGEFLVYAKKV